MTNKTYEPDSFGAYFVKLIKDHNYSQIKFAKELGISKTYLFDIFNSRVKPPTPAMQERIVKLLHLRNEERNEFFTRAANGRNELPKDIVEYLINNQSEIDSIRNRIGG